MATAQENLARFQEIANRGLQDKLDLDKRARFDEAVKRGLVKSAEKKTYLDGVKEIGMDLLTGKAQRDVVGNIVSGAIAEPVAGLIGAASVPLMGAEKSGEVVEKTRDLLTIEPTSNTGKGMLNALGTAVGVPLNAARSGLEYVGEKIGGDAGAVVGRNLPDAILQIIGFKGTRLAKKAAIEKEIAQNPAALTPEVEQVLKDQGFDDVEIKRVDPAQAERAARAAEFDTTLTKGELSQDLAVQKPEQALLESGTDQSAQSFRTLKREQSTAIRASVEKTIDSLGVPDEVGTSLKETLASRKELLKSQRRTAYEQLSQTANGQNIPVIPNNLTNGLPDKGTQRTIAATNPAAYKAYSELLVEFGIDTDAPAVQRLSDAGIEITPLSLSNQEAFRRRLGVISKSDPSGQMEVLIGPIRKNLDDEVDLMSQTLERSGNPNVAELAKQARQAHIALRTEFDPKSITEKLISKKTNSVLPNVEESKVFQTVASNSLAVEEVSRLMDSLEASGSKKAVGDLQSAMLMDLIDSAYSASTRKIDGVPIFGGPAFQKRFRQLQPKLEVIFRKNPQAYERLQSLNELAKDLTPPSGAVPKGSAGYLMDSLQHMGLLKITSMIPGGGVLVESLKSLGEKAKSRKVLDNAMKAKPEMREAASVIATDYPGLAAALGIGYLSQESKETKSSSSINSRNR